MNNRPSHNPFPTRPGHTPFDDAPLAEITGLHCPERGRIGRAVREHPHSVIIQFDAGGELALYGKSVVRMLDRVS